MNSINLTDQQWRLLSKHVKEPTRFKIPEGGQYVLDIWKTAYTGLEYYEAFHLIRNGIKEKPKCDVCGKHLILKRNPSLFYKQCCRKAHNKTSVKIDGETYTSKTEAKEKLNLSTFNLDLLLLEQDPSILLRYNKNGEISKEKLKQLIQDRTTIRDISKHFGVDQERIIFLFKAYNLPTKWYQLGQEAYDFLYDKARFINEFEQSNSEELARKYNCSPSTILQWADKYNIDRGPRFQSEIERELITFIKSLDDSLEVLSRDKSAIGIEIDIFVPSKKLGIECDGLYYHTDSPPFDNRNKHLEKQKLAYKNGIQLIRFVDIGETTHKLDIVKSMIKSKLGYTEKVYARKCQIVEITNKESKSFFDSNHLSGHTNASFVYALKKDDKILMCCSFSKSRFDKTTEWELIRQATTQGITVVGGLSKLIKHFRSRHKGSLLTYANLRYGQGKGYEAAGFRYVGVTSPGYFYTDMTRNFSRFSFQKNQMSKTLKNFDPGLSEVENAWNNGFRRYKDCGHVKYVLE